MASASGPDKEEKFDPAAEIWARQKKKEQEAARKKHEAKNDNLDQVRKQVKLQEPKSAQDTWAEAEAALKETLGSRRQEAKQAAWAAEDMQRAATGAGERDLGLRRTGQNVAHRRHREAQQQQSVSPQASPPLKRTRKPEASDTEDMMDASSSRPASPSGLSSPSRMAARQDCFDNRSKQRRLKSVVAAENKAVHEKRRLRAKIASVLIEVRKRQDLHQLENKQKKFQEQRHARGRGPAPMGDTTEYALGLTCLSDSGPDAVMTSPRRTALLDSLILEELALVREQPGFFFSGNQISSAVPREHSMHTTTEKSRSVGALPSVSSMPSREDSRGSSSLFAGPVNPQIFDDIVEFFSVSHADKALDVKIYARKLRAQLIAEAGQNRPGANAGDVDWRKRLCRSDPDDMPQEEQPQLEEAPKGPLEMMPSLGRHPQLRNDQESPTLMRVREVYERRDEQDAKWIEDRRETIARRLALNAFKAREQQRELLLQGFKQKELHKVRMLQAEENKAMMDAEVAERTEVMGIQKIHRLMLANDRAERIKEDKRDNAQIALEHWQAGVDCAKQYAKRTEWEKRKDLERSHEKYQMRLQTIGESRLNVSKTQGQLNDKLKTNIQVSLSAQLKEVAAEESIARAEAYNAKIEAARFRRSQMQHGNRYGLVEKAFGANSVGFDAKVHSVAVDRRGQSWQKSAEAWTKMKSSFSAPDLQPPRPMSPGGAINEASFKEIVDTTGFKTGTLAVATELV